MKIKAVELQTAITMHGTKAAGSTTLNTIRYPGLKMEWTDKGLLVELGGYVEIIPHANVKSARTFAKSIDQVLGRKKEEVKEEAA